MHLLSSSLELLENYINLDTSQSDGRNYSAVIELFSERLQTLGFSCEKIEVPEEVAGKPNRVNLIARFMVDPNFPTLLIYNHIDVVPANYPGAFHFRVDGGKVYGRGAADHKGSTVALMDALAQTDIEHSRFNLIFLLTTDEEIDQLAQLTYLEKFLQLDSQKTLCFDPDTFAGGITAANLGAYQFQVVVKGKSVHSAASHLGINAIEAFGKLFPTFQKLQTQLEQQKSHHRSFPKDGKTAQITSKFNVNMIAGGTASNVIPDHVAATIDARFIPEENVTQSREYIHQELQKAFKKLKITGEVHDQLLLEGLATSGKELDRLDAILEQVSSEKGQYCVMGSTPVAMWMKKLGIPHFGIGVARYDSNVHGVDENCSIKDIEILSEVFSKYIVKS